MKLQELAVTAPTRQVAKVFESYFGDKISFDSLTTKQVRNMLGRVRTLIKEHRRQPAFHRSEKNPAYLKLVMMEQGLASRLRETDLTADEEIKKIQDPKLKMAMTKAKSGQSLTPDEQKMVAGAALMKTEGRRRIREASEVQQAQVVLASKDMVDQVQKMIETATSIQFKDLPALVDQIRNEIGYDQATRFNADATAALGGMVQNLQGSKQQLEAAMGVVTGQAPQVPGADMGAAPPAADAGLPAEPGAEVDADLSLDANLPGDEEEPEMEPKAALGRSKR